MKQILIKPIRFGSVVHTSKRALSVILVLILVVSLLRCFYSPILNRLGDTQLETSDHSSQLWMRSVLLNVSNFKYIINNESRCHLKNGQNIRLLSALVHTARSHFKERLVIRKSWGSVPIYRQWDVRLVFLLGEANPNETNSTEIDSALYEEHTKFGDIVLGSFVDSYRNLTYKHLMGYKWILNYCSHADFVLKTDDDLFVDILQWLDWRSTEMDTIVSGSASKAADLYCYSSNGKGPIRKKGGPVGQWYVSREEWPEDTYPIFCSGWAYGITVDAIRKVYSVSNDLKYFWIDDMFVTGALLEVAKQKYKWTPERRELDWNHTTCDFMLWSRLCEKSDWNSKREFPELAYVDRADAEIFERDMVCLWNKTWHDVNSKHIYSDI